MNQNELKTMKATVEELRRRADILDKIVKSEEKAQQELIRKAEGRAKPVSEEIGKMTADAVGHYCTEWKARYKAQGLMTKQGVGQLQNMVKEFGVPKVKALISAYLKMNDSWFIKKRHDLVTLKQNLQTVSHFAETGAIITNTKLNQIDRMSDLQSMSQRVLDGEL